MPQFRYQVQTTHPENWRTVEYDDPRTLVLHLGRLFFWRKLAAGESCPDSVDVHIADPDSPTHATGAPFRVHTFTVVRDTLSQALKG